MNYREWQDLIPFYIAQTLRPDQRRAFEQYMAHCADCQREINQWREIAAAVWTETELIAGQVPPLSQTVYNQLRPTEDRPFRQSVTEAPPRRRIPAAPLTLAASIAALLVFGGAWIALTLTNSDRNPANDQALVAVNATQSGDDDTGDIFGAAPVITPTPVPPTATPTPTTLPPTHYVLPPAILPPTVMPSPMPNVAPSQSDETVPNNIPPDALGMGGGLAPQALEAPTETPCLVVNVGSATVNVYAYADPAAPVSGTLQPGDNRRTFVQSGTGWYQVYRPRGETPAIWGWVQSGQVMLRGNCPAALPVATATQSPLPSSTPET